MTNKEFLEKVSQKTNLGMDQVKDMSASLVSAVLEGIAQGNSVTIQGFVPSKTTLSYKMSAALKTQLNKE